MFLFSDSERVYFVCILRCWESDGHPSRLLTFVEMQLPNYSQSESLDLIGMSGVITLVTRVTTSDHYRLRRLMLEYLDIIYLYIGVCIYL